MPKVLLQAANFPLGAGVQSYSEVSFTWGELIWAALTVGRPGWRYVFQHGASSLYEALCRVSQVRMAVEQHSSRGNRLYRTPAFKSLDPTEKSSVSYSLGLIICKLMAAKLLSTPWVMHLDVYGALFSAQLFPGRSRPDLIGKQSGALIWHSFECKGRSTRPDSATIAKAKAQAGRIKSVGGVACTLHVASFSYFNGDRLDAYWEDPDTDGRSRELPPVPSWRSYYAPIFALSRMRRQKRRDGALDLTVTAHPKVRAALEAGDWDGAREIAEALQFELTVAGYQPDGFRVEAGASWFERYNPSEA